MVSKSFFALGPFIKKRACVLCRYLTNCVASVVRFPIGFKSRFNGHYYYHVVLGILHKGRFGALGISRRPDLMDKPLIFKVFILAFYYDNKFFDF